jgi:hypothetical protein
MVISLIKEEKPFETKTKRALPSLAELGANLG